MAHIFDDDSPRAATMNDRERGRLLGILHEICLDRGNSDLREFAMTQAALALHATWEQVADASGVSQDAARDRYGALRRRFAPPGAPAVFGPFVSVPPVPRDEPETIPAIFVPIRDNCPGMTPSRIADLQRMLNDMVAVMFGDVVEGKFITLPPGAKVVLPSHPGREWIRVPPEMTGPNYERIVTARREWGQVWPGLECLLSSFGGVNEDAQATIVLRLARPAEDSR